MIVFQSIRVTSPLPPCCPKFSEKCTQSLMAAASEWAIARRKFFSRSRSGPEGRVLSDNICWVSISFAAGPSNLSPEERSAGFSKHAATVSHNSEMSCDKSSVYHTKFGIVKINLAIENRLNINLACQVQLLGRRSWSFIILLQNLPNSDAIHFHKRLRVTLSTNVTFHRDWIVLPVVSPCPVLTSEILLQQRSTRCEWPCQ